MKDLDFQMQKQEHSNWCWAAVSVSVDRFFDSGSSWQQCGMAHAELGLPCCEGTDQRCNKPFFLEQALDRVGRLKGSPQPAPLSFSQIKLELDAGHPVGVRIEWNDGSGHFVLITGYNETPGVQRLTIDDPFYDRSRVSYSGFLNRYQGSGAWTGTFFLKE
jgi:hypothetical protein